MTSLFNQAQTTNNNNFQQNQIITEYPEVFYTQGNKEQTNIQHTHQSQQSRKGILGNLNISKDMIGQFLPLLFGNGGNTNNLLGNLLQGGMLQNGNNNILSKLFSGNNDISQILSALNNSSKKYNNEEKKDISNIIDMSDYIEIKN